MIPQNEATIAGRIENFQTARIDTEIKLKELQRKRESLHKQLTGEKELTVAFVTRDGSPEGRLNQLNNQLVQLMAKYTPDHPDVIKVKGEIEDLEQEIADATKSGKASAAGNTSSAAAGSETKAMNPVYRQIKEELSKTDTEIDSLKARLDELVKQQDLGRSILGRIPKDQQEWEKLQRDRSAYQQVYDELIRKRESARVTKNLEFAGSTTTFHVVDPAVLPKLPVSPNRIKLILYGFLLGIAAGVGVAILLDHIDNSFKDEDTLQEGLRLPVLASVPTITTEADIAAEAVLDKKVFTAAAVYASLIGLVFIGEFLYRFVGLFH